MVQDELSKDDVKRIKNCDYYEMVKNIMKSHEEYKELKIGDVYFIKKLRYGTEWKYVSRAYNGKKDKFMIFHKDEEGFVFAKRINANGKLGKEVHCITTQYPAPKHVLEPDPEYIESIIFAEEESYDPLKAEKLVTKKKGQARRKNKKIEIGEEDALAAFKLISQYTVGDKIYDSGTSYGDGIMEWEVVKVEARKTCKTKVEGRWINDPPRIGKTAQDQAHNRNNLDDFVQIDIVCRHDKPKSRRWTNTGRSLTFDDFIKSRYKNTYYKVKPYTLDDV
jgi:hypothetical protein